MHVSIQNIGEHRNHLRVWLQGEKLNAAGFGHKATYTYSKRQGAVVLTRVAGNEAGVEIREVSGRKKNEGITPIIDFNNQDTSDMFKGLTRVRVVYGKHKIQICPLASEIRARERLEAARKRMNANEPLRFGSLAHGGGVLTHALSKGFELEGLKKKLVFANEYREELVDHAMQANSAWSKDTIALEGPMQEYAYDEWVLSQLGQVDVLEAGLPCSGASVAGRAKRGLVHPEAHPEVGHLVAAFITFIARVNPLMILLENVTQYQNTASMDILRNYLRDLGYDVYENVLTGAEFNEMEDRKRMGMVAVTRGVPFDWNDLVRPQKVERHLSEILEDLPDDHPSWSEMTGLKAKEIRDKEAGKSFAMQIFEGSDTRIATMTKDMTKNRSTDPKIRHPRNPNLLRVPTPGEHAAAKGIPKELVDGLPATTAHQILGQSINYAPFVATGRLMARSFLSLRDLDEASLSFRSSFLAEAVIAKAQRQAAMAERMKMN